MKKQVWRHEELAPFSLNIEELRAFCLALSEEFDDPEDVSISIEVKLPGGVSLEFESVEEMVGEMTGGDSLVSTPDVIHDYTIQIRGEGRYISIECRSWNPKATISVRSEREGWCAGMIEAVSSALRKHRVWYRWIPRRSFWGFVSLLPFIYVIWRGLVFQDWTHSLLEWAGFAAIYLFGHLMITVQERIHTAGAIRVREKEGFLRRRSTELKVIAALISAVALTIALFKNWTFGS